MSSEHYLSNGLFDVERPVTFSGFTWQEPGSKKDLNVEALGAKILCRNHNSTLSCLDDQARKLSDALLAFIVHRQPTTIEINRDLLERWLLKAWCGALASGSSRRGAIQPPESLVRMVFGLTPVPHGLGFWGLVGVKDPHNGQGRVMRPLWDDAGAPLGAIIGVAGFYMLISLTAGDPTMFIRSKPILRGTDVQTMPGRNRSTGPNAFGWELNRLR